MGGFFDTSCLDVRYGPYIAGVLAEGVAAKLSSFVAPVVSFARILLGHANRIDIEVVVVTLRIPEHYFMATAKAAASMRAATEGPDDPVPQLDAWEF